MRLIGEAGFQCRAPALPGHAPSDPAALAWLTLEHYLAALRREVAELSAPPVIIGHSMGGLLAQQLASVLPCRALVCVASAPPWLLRPEMRTLPYLLPMLPTVLRGVPIRAPEAILRNLALHDLPEWEQRRLLPTFGMESGLAYRALVLGSVRLPGAPFRGPVLCLSGGADRLISSRTSRAIARYYAARHVSFPERGHWLIGASAEPEVGGSMLRWLQSIAGD
jgi:pimeloyl-ACP methyl ester carboxylesterase